MPALSQAYESFEKPGLVVSYKASAAKLYKGSLIGVNAGGFAARMDHAVANLKFVGVANETVDNASGAAGDKVLNMTKSGSFVMKAASGFTPAQADIGKEVYANTDWEVQVSTSGLTNQYKVGTIVGLETTSTGATGVRVRIDNHTV
ncbi:MAG TPA: hypothetical protein PLH94_14640 [Fimbriimonadaceae bacterium]|nr:hypothetical protein [Fimbriimonadaceae bacterium]